MDANTVAELKLASHRFNQFYGKYQIEEATAVLGELDLKTAAREIVASIIAKVYSCDAFAGFLRYDGIVQRIDLAVLRQLKAQPEG